MMKQTACTGQGSTTLYLLSESITVTADDPEPQLLCTDALNPSFTFTKVKVDVKLGGTYAGVALNPPLTWAAINPSTATCTPLVDDVFPTTPPPTGIGATGSYYFNCTVTQWGDNEIKFEGATVKSGV